MAKANESEPVVLGNFISRALTSDLNQPNVIAVQTQAPQVAEPDAALLARIAELEAQLAGTLSAAPELEVSTEDVKEVTTKAKATK